MHSPKQKRIESAEEPTLPNNINHLMRDLVGEMVVNMNDKNFTALLNLGLASRHACPLIYKLVKFVDSVYFHENSVYFEFAFNYIEFNREKHGEVLFNLALMNTPLIAGISVCELWFANLLAKRTKPLIFDVTDMFREVDVLRFPCVKGIRVENFNVRLAKIVRKFSSIQHVEMTITGEVGLIPRVVSLIVNLRYVKQAPTAVFRNWYHEPRYYDSYCVNTKNVPIIPTLPTTRVPLHYERNEALETAYFAQRRVQLYQKMPPAVKRLVIRDHYYNAIYEKIGQPRLSLAHYYRFFGRRLEYLELDLLLRVDCRPNYSETRIRNILENLYAFSKEFEKLDEKSKVKQYKVKVQYEYLMKYSLFDNFLQCRYLASIKKQLVKHGFYLANEDVDSMTYKIEPKPYAQCYIHFFRNDTREEGE